MDQQPQEFGAQHEELSQPVGMPPGEDSAADEEAGTGEAARESAELLATGVREARRIEWKGRRVVWFGRIRAVCVQGTTVFVGPHWYCSVLMLVIIVGVGLMYVFGIATNSGALHMALGVASTVWSTWAFLRCALSDPGIVSPSGYRPASGSTDPIQLLPSSGRRACVPCGIVQPKGSLHCEYCQVCVSGYDHHCPWMSKCIGGQNLAVFYSFLCVSLGSLAYIVIATMLAPMNRSR